MVEEEMSIKEAKKSWVIYIYIKLLIFMWLKENSNGLNSKIK